MSFDAALVWAIATALLAGATRGFSGFGGALIFMPLVGAVFGPKLAAPTLLIIDTLLTLPMVLRAMRACIWRQVAPLAIGAVLAVPFGVLVLEQVDPVALRWAIAALAVVLLMLLIFGQGLKAPQSLAAKLGIGAVSGLLGGAAQLSGPPVVVYWLGTGQNAALVRANLFAFFALVTLASGTAYLGRGLVDAEVMKLSLVLGPTYALGLVAGARGFRLASDRQFRLIAYAIIALAAIASVPLLDPLLRP
ncbi:sulfite exporter TauE/SafE family protein [Ancylobacter defluvii]|uniref:Probable membrane transporter protein n=1 Tax=Ancylobacter defluvii TaxID=1282440 RepID=A0A9W6N977_9HYPH|nr:sulfite exporter TauE/SafE family protein [Ancylobacter defluvii]MBS7587491.1 sulfite exporter TauE/SafE family protein [Ancylobacter defluvii]GLK82182.1 membrane protein [Ancylobacter defluvii]